MSNSPFLFRKARKKARTDYEISAALFPFGLGLHSPDLMENPVSKTASPFSYGPPGSEKRMIDLVRRLLEKYKVDVYVCGHDHDLQLLGPVSGAYYIVTGIGSKSRNTSYGATTIFAETGLGFVWSCFSRRVS